jgi:hypothetical protein
MKVSNFFANLFKSKLAKRVEELEKQVANLEAINKREEERRLNNKRRYGNKKSV